MHIGCGVYELRIRNRPYLYFWHYESKGGRRVQVKEYLGPSGSPDARLQAGRRREAYFDRVAAASRGSGRGPSRTHSGTDDCAEGLAISRLVMVK